MKFIIFIVVLSLLFIIDAKFCNAYTFMEKWTAEDTYYQAAANILKIIDWGQTRHIAKNPNDHYEMLPFMGSEHPSVGRVDTYFIAGLVIQNLISMALPPKAKIFGYDINPRRIWQYIQIGASGSCVSYNFNVGIKIDF